MAKLTAAIEAIKMGAVLTIDQPPLRESYIAAIHLLEAAEKVDRDRALRVLATLLKHYVDNSTPQYNGPQFTNIPELDAALEAGAIKEIRALIESLPEPGPAKTEESNDELLARLDRQIRDDRLDEAHPLDPEKTEKPK